MTDKKYELTDKEINIDGHILHRIKALKDFTLNDGRQIKAGDLGGFIESEDNLSQDGNCWVGSYCYVYGGSKVSDNALVRVYDETSDYFRESNYLRINENSKIYGDAYIFVRNKSPRHAKPAEMHNIVIGDNANLNIYAHRGDVMLENITMNDKSFINIDTGTPVPNRFPGRGQFIYTPAITSIRLKDKVFKDNEGISDYKEYCQKYAPEDLCKILPDEYDVSVDEYGIIAIKNIPNKFLWFFKGETSATLGGEAAWEDISIPRVTKNKDGLSSTIFLKANDKLRKGYHRNIYDNIDCHDVSVEQLFKKLACTPKILQEVRKLNNQPSSTKYELTYNSVTVNEEILYQIRALSDFKTHTGTEIKAGTLGGYIKDTSVLSQKGTCWIDKGVAVFSDKEINGSVYINGDENAKQPGIITFSNSEVRNETYFYVTEGSTIDVTDSLIEANGYDDSSPSIYAKDGSNLILNNVKTYGSAYIGVKNGHTLQIEFTSLNHKCYIGSIESDVFIVPKSGFYYSFGDMDACVDSDVRVKGNFKDFKDAIEAEFKESTIKAESKIAPQVASEVAHQAELAPEPEVAQQVEPASEPTSEPTVDEKPASKEKAETETEKPADKASKSSGRMYINRISEKLIHTTKYPDTLRVSIPDKNSNTGYGSIFVKSSQVFTASRTDGTPMVGFNNISLGKASREVKYTYVDENGNYQNKQLPVKDIVDMFNEDRKQYLASNNLTPVVESDKTMDKEPEV